MPEITLTAADDFLVGKRLVLNVGTKKYIVKEASGDRFLRLQRMGAFVLGGGQMTDPRIGEFMDIEGGDLHEFVLGKDVVQKMAKDDLQGSVIDHATTTAFFWHIGQAEEFLKAVFEGAGKAKAPRKRAPSKTAPRTRSAAASTTRRRASGTTTNTRQN